MDYKAKLFKAVTSCSCRQLQNSKNELRKPFWIDRLSRGASSDKYVLVSDCVCNGAGGTTIFQALCGRQEVLRSTSTFCYAYRLYGGTKFMLWYNRFFLYLSLWAIFNRVSSALLLPCFAFWLVQKTRVTFSTSHIQNKTNRNLVTRAFGSLLVFALSSYYWLFKVFSPLLTGFGFA